MPWVMTPSATSPATSFMRGPDGGQEDPGRSERVRRRGEDGRHQGVGVEVALEVERGPVVPRRPDRPQGEHVLPHPCRRVRPRGAEPLLDVPPHLRPHPQHDAPARVLLQLVGRVRHAHRVAGEGHGDPRPEGHATSSARRPASTTGTGRSSSRPPRRSPARPPRRQPPGRPPGAAPSRGRCRSSTVALTRAAVFLIRRRTGAGVGAGPLTAGASTDSDSGSPPGRSVPPPGGGSGAAAHGPRPGGRPARRRGARSPPPGRPRTAAPTAPPPPSAARRRPRPRRRAAPWPRHRRATSPNSPNARSNPVRWASVTQQTVTHPSLARYRWQPHRRTPQVRSDPIRHRTRRSPTPPRPRTGTPSPSTPTTRPPPSPPRPRARPNSASTIPAPSSSPVP